MVADDGCAGMTKTYRPPSPACPPACGMLSADRMETRKDVAEGSKADTASATGTRLMRGMASGPVASGTTMRGTVMERLGRS